MSGTMRQLWTLLQWMRSWTRLDCEMLSLPDILQVLLTEFACMTEFIATKSMVLGLPDLA